MEEDAALHDAFRGISNASVRAYLMEMPENDRIQILRSKAKIQELEQRVARSISTLGSKTQDKSDFESMMDLYYKTMTMPKPAFYANYGTSFQQQEIECEVRFGTNRKSGRTFSKLDYDNVVEQFLRAGFQTDQPEGMHMLRIQSEYFNHNKQQTIFSNIRTELCGIDTIQQYCKTNNIRRLLEVDSTKVKFTQKRAPELKGQLVKPVEQADFNFRVAYQVEKNFTTTTSDAVQRMVDGWLQSKKSFRYLNRVRFRHPQFPVFLDVSIVRSSASEYNPNTKQRVTIPKHTVQDAKVMESAESYEIELEMDNCRIPEMKTIAPFLSAVRHCIRLVLSGIQGSPYPISFSERDKVLQSYMLLVHGEDYVKHLHSTKINSYHFIGPNPMTLQLEHIQESAQPNIRTEYSVTDKADGVRKLLYVMVGGKVYLVDTAMNVVFTGMVTSNKKLFGTLLDGEHIKLMRDGTETNKFKTFDVYFIGGESKRHLALYAPFDPTIGSKDKWDVSYRLPLMQRAARELMADQPQTTFAVDCKTFLTTHDRDVFAACDEIWTAIQHPAYEYKTDGLIFTPTNCGVGSDHANHTGPLHRHVWKAQLKWKPPEYNTIDFLVRVKHDATLKDDIRTRFQSGRDLCVAQQTPAYKTLTLCCGFSVKDHGYKNPLAQMINDEMQQQVTEERENEYLPCPFEPLDPPDPRAHVCDWPVVDKGNGDYVMFTEEGEYFDEDMIVEFRYDRGAGRWIPLRVRYDKTNELRMGYKQFGNAFHVAESNWRSIWFDITPDMITSGKNIPRVLLEDVYYHRMGSETEMKTHGLRQFHNLVVKRNLLLGVCSAGDTLIDLGVGKAGDLRKWNDAKLNFVFGIDLSQDNIENRKDGACARYLSMTRQLKQKGPKALFLQGNVEQNIRDGDAFTNAKEKRIAKALFGQGPRDKDELGAGVYPHYGVGERGFQVSSCQFAVHYFFGSQSTLHAFLRNVSECTREQGYFVCTCFDGKTVYDRLKRLEKGNSMRLTSDEEQRVIFEIRKQYDNPDEGGFPDDEESLGYAIDVYQESINTMNREYLVNVEFFKRTMEKYGFMLVNDAEAQGKGFPSGSDMFERVFDRFAQEFERPGSPASDFSAAYHMTEVEKTISFLNRYYIFKKVRTVEELEKMGRETKDDDLKPNLAPSTSLPLPDPKKDEKVSVSKKPTSHYRKVASSKIKVEIQ
jgi:hypothetical protein